MEPQICFGFKRYLPNVTYIHHYIEDMEILHNLRDKFDVPYYVNARNFRQLFIGGPVHTLGKCRRYKLPPILNISSKYAKMMTYFINTPDVKPVYKQNVPLGGVRLKNLLVQHISKNISLVDNHTQQTSGIL